MTSLKVIQSHCCVLGTKRQHWLSCLHGFQTQRLIFVINKQNKSGWGWGWGVGWVFRYSNRLTLLIQLVLTCDWCVWAGCFFSPLWHKHSDLLMPSLSEPVHSYFDPPAREHVLTMTATINTITSNNTPETIIIIKHIIFLSIYLSHIIYIYIYMAVWNIWQHCKESSCLTTHPLVVQLK